jgi:endonuclease YncB( thermonuclease family)
VEIIKVDGDGGKTLNERLVRSDMVWVFTKYCNQPPICDQWIQIEAGAKKSKVGLWTHPNPIPLRKYRQGDKAQIQTALTASDALALSHIPATQNRRFMNRGWRVYNCKN